MNDLLWCCWTLSSSQGTGGSFSIDSEEYEAMPVEVKLLPRKLQFFCDPRKREQLLPSSAPWAARRRGPQDCTEATSGTKREQMPQLSPQCCQRIPRAFPWQVPLPFSHCLPTSALCTCFPLAHAFDSVRQSFPQLSSRTLTLSGWRRTRVHFVIFPSTTAVANRLPDSLRLSFGYPRTSAPESWLQASPGRCLVSSDLACFRSILNPKL